MATNDEQFDNRKVAIKLLGRLALHNPAYVMPSLRKALIQLMTELQFAAAMYVQCVIPIVICANNLLQSHSRRV